MTTPLDALLRRRIAATGPISIADFMAEALGHPRHGYYMRRDPFGAGGDFVTAPEISQMFGELIGLWAASVWRQMGGPPSFNLIELGPGRGTLMADALRALALDRGARRAARVHLVETSPALAQAQRVRLDGIGAAWHLRLADVPPGPTVVLANEFFDALPVHQVERTPEGWRERMIGLGADEALAIALAPDPTPMSALVERDRADAALGAVAEVSPAAAVMARDVATRIAGDGGAALIVDFGGAKPGTAGTLQAVRRHARAGVLDSPGDIDLAAAVDFGLIARIARAAGARAHGPLGQGAFLRALGIEERARRLAGAGSIEQRAKIEVALGRLIDDDAMGRHFKALALSHASQGAPAGFEPALETTR